MISFFQKRFFTTIGLDIGNINSYISILESTGPRIIENSEGFRVTPSYITIMNDKEKDNLHGNNSKNSAILNKKTTFYGLNLFFDKPYSNQNMQKIMSNLNYQVRPSKNNNLLFGDAKHTLPYLLSQHVNYLKSQAENLIGKPVTKAIVSFPSYLTQIGQNEYQKIINESGIKVLKCINESISSVYGYYGTKNLPNKVLVVNIGGMKCNFSYLEKNNNSINKNKLPSYKIIKDVTNFEIGGNYFDKEIIDYLLYYFQKETNLDITNDLNSLQRIYTSAEKAKIELSNSPQTTINIPFLTIDKKGIPKHLNISLSKSKYETLVDHLISKIYEQLKQFKNECKITKLDDILLVGGMTRMPKIQKLISDLFPNCKINKSINPEEAPCLGSSRISPYYQDQKQSITNINKLPLSLGIETLGGKFEKLIEKNELLPIEITKMATTIIDNQPKIEIKCYLGERPIAKDNIHLCTLNLPVPLAKREGIKIQIFANVDNDGNFTVGAIETMTKKSTVMNLNILQYCDEEIVKRNIEKARKNEEKDKVKENNILDKVKIDYFIYQIEKNLKEMVQSNKIDKVKKEKIEKLINEINLLLNENKILEVNKKLELLEKEINNNHIFAKIYNEYLYNYNKKI